MKTLDEFIGQRKTQFLPQSDCSVSDGNLRLAHTGHSALHIEVNQVAELASQVLKANVLGIERPIEDGITHQIWIVDLEGESVVVRTNSLPDELTDFPMVVEADITRHLSGLGFPVVETRCVDLSRTRFRTDFSILNEAKGLPLNCLDDDERLLLPLLTDLGRWLGKLHSERVAEGFGWIAINPEKPIHQEADAHHTGLCGLQQYWSDFLELNLETHLRKCVQLNAIDLSEANRIEGWFTRLCPLFDESPAALLHNDPTPANIHTDGRKIRAILDWEDALIGDPLFDVAGWATSQPMHRHEALLNGYFSEQQKPSDFHPRFWFYFTRIALAWTVLRDRLGLVDSPVRAPAALRIRHGLQELERLEHPHRRAG